MYKSLSVALSLSLFSLTIPLSAKASVLTFTPNNQITELGDKVNVDLTISGLGDNIDPALGTFDVVVGFDDSIIDFDSATFGNQLNFSNSILGTAEEIFTPPNSLRLFEISGELPDDLVASQADSFTLATVTLDTVGLGTTNLSFGNVVLGDENGDPLSDVNLAPGAITVEPGNPGTAVPEASNILSLLALGIGGLMFLSNCKVNRQKF
jgi:hypothetical protein